MTRPQTSGLSACTQMPRRRSPLPSRQSTLKNGREIEPIFNKKRRTQCRSTKTGHYLAEQDSQDDHQDSDPPAVSPHLDGKIVVNDEDAAHRDDYDAGTTSEQMATTRATEVHHRFPLSTSKPSGTFTPSNDPPPRITNRESTASSSSLARSIQVSRRTTRTLTAGQTFDIRRCNRSRCTLQPDDELSASKRQRQLPISSFLVPVGTHQSSTIRSGSLRTQPSHPTPSLEDFESLLSPVTSSPPITNTSTSGQLTTEHGMNDVEKMKYPP
jgi:hypothetical protein